MTNLKSLTNEATSLVLEIKELVADNNGFVYVVRDEDLDMYICSSVSEALALSGNSEMISFSSEDFEKQSLWRLIANVVSYFGWEIMYREAVKLLSVLHGGKLSQEKGVEYLIARANYDDLSFDTFLAVDEAQGSDVLIFDQSIMEQDCVGVINDLMELAQDNLSVHGLMNIDDNLPDH